MCVCVCVPAYLCVHLCCVNRFLSGLVSCVDVSTRSEKLLADGLPPVACTSTRQAQHHTWPGTHEHAGNGIARITPTLPITALYTLFTRACAFLTSYAALWRCVFPSLCIHAWNATNPFLSASTLTIPVLARCFTCLPCVHYVL